MKVNLAKSAGFCFGVKRAIELALATTSTRKNVYMLGDIVHNEEVTRRINASGIKRIKRLSPGRGRVLLIRAHGTRAAVLARASALGYHIVDATCPMVKEIHKIAKEISSKGYRVIVIGDKKHDEVRGIFGQLAPGAAVAIDHPHDFAIRRLKKTAKYAVVVQSTQNIEKVMGILTTLKDRLKHVKFFNTICRPTTIKQQEIRRMPAENDVMLIIGSRSSANTRRLYEISKSINKRSHWVGSAGQIRRSWFSGAKKVGVTAGASTPNSTIHEVVNRVRSYS